MNERMRRVNEAVREVVSQGVGDLKDPRIGFVTVTGVETTSDLAQATVWLSVPSGCPYLVSARCSRSMKELSSPLARRSCIR